MILFDATALQSEHRLRGVGAYVRQLIGALEALGTDTGANNSVNDRVSYLVSTTGLEHTRALPPERTLRVARRHQPAQVYWLYSEWAFRPVLRRYRPEVFFAPDFNGLVTNRYGRTTAVLYDLTALKLGSEGAPKTLSERLSDLRWRAYAHKLRRADGVLAISQSAKDDAVALLGLPENRIDVVHLGLDHTRFVPSLGHGPFAARPPYFVNIGGRGANKNQARILAAFARFAASAPANAEVQLLFAGPWSSADLSWLGARCRDLGLGSKAQHVGYIPDEALPSLYGNALALVFPSLEEGFGLPVLEAMACGAPVITSNRSSLPEVAGDAALLVDPLSVDALAAAMESVLDGGVRTGLRARGFARAASFTWQRTAQRTLAYLRQGA